MLTTRGLLALQHINILIQHVERVKRVLVYIVRVDAMWRDVRCGTHNSRELECAVLYLNLLDHTRLD